MCFDISYVHPIIVLIMKFAFLGSYAAIRGKRVFRGQESFGSLPLKMGPKGCPETSVRDCHYTLRNNTEELSFHLHCGGSLKSCTDFLLRFIAILMHIGNCYAAPNASAIYKIQL